MQRKVQAGVKASCRNPLLYLLLFGGWFGNDGTPKQSQLHKLNCMYRCDCAGKEQIFPQR